MQTKKKSENSLADVFFVQCKTKDPQRYAEIAESYPILNPRQMEQINQREVGIEELSIEEAEAHGFVQSFEDN